MKRAPLLIPGSFALLFAIGCGTATQAPNSPTQVNYTAGTSYTYKDNQLDTADNPKQSTTDTITSKVVATNTIYGGKAGVTVLVNTHSNGAGPDTTYIAQDGGNFWHYNYGLEALNSNPTVVTALGSTIQVGWVLQAKFNAVSGDKWTAADTVVRLKGYETNVHVDAVEKADTTLALGSVPITAKHVLHTTTLSMGGLPLASTTVDTYVSVNVGVALNIVHSTKVSLPGTYSGPVAGRETVLIK